METNDKQITISNSMYDYFLNHNADALLTPRNIIGGFILNLFSIVLLSKAARRNLFTSLMMHDAMTESVAGNALGEVHYI